MASSPTSHPTTTMPSSRAEVKRRAPCRVHLLHVSVHESVPRVDGKAASAILSATQLVQLVLVRARPIIVRNTHARAGLPDDGVPEILARGQAPLERVGAAQRRHRVRRIDGDGRRSRPGPRGSVNAPEEIRTAVPARDGLQVSKSPEPGDQPRRAGSSLLHQMNVSAPARFAVTTSKLPLLPNRLWMNPGAPTAAL
jgi:hypothetical protein